MTCANCKNFIPDTIGDGSGIGKCQLYEDYKLKTNSLSRLHSARVTLGNKYDDDIFWPVSGKNCERYEIK